MNPASEQKESEQSRLNDEPRDTDDRWVSHAQKQTSGRFWLAFVAILLLALPVMIWRFGSLSNGLNVVSRQLSGLLSPQKLARSAGGAYATTDSYLHVLNISEPSAKVLTAFQTIPTDKALLFVAPVSDPSIALTYNCLSYLAWPRQIEFYGEAQHSNLPKSAMRTTQKITGVLCYRCQPRKEFEGRSVPGLNSIRIGSELTLLYHPAPEKVDWNSVCSP